MNIVKLGTEEVLPQKPKFNRRHLDDIFKQLWKCFIQPFKFLLSKHNPISNAISGDLYGAKRIP